MKYVNSALQRLGFAMRDLRKTSVPHLDKLAAIAPWSKGYLSKVENGETAPPREMVEYYDIKFMGDGQLVAYFNAYLFEQEVEARRRRQVASTEFPQPLLYSVELAVERRQSKRDSSKFAGQSPADGIIVAPSDSFEVTWTVKNDGEIVWADRFLVREGPPAGTGLMTSPSRVPIRTTKPGQRRDLTVPFIAPHADTTSTSHWKMAYDDNVVCFPDKYSNGLSITVTVRGNRARKSQ